MINYERKNPDDFIPSCVHFKLEDVRRKIKVLVNRGEKVDQTNLFDMTLPEYEPVESNFSIAGRLMYTKNGNFLFFQQKLTIGRGPEFVVIPCEISGKFRVNKLLKCCRTELTFVSCWLVIRNWEIIDMNTDEETAPLRSCLLDRHLDQLDIQYRIKEIEVIEKKLLCFNAATVSWIKPVYIVRRKHGKDFNALLKGTISHISTVVMHRIDYEVASADDTSDNEVTMSDNQMNNQGEVQLVSQDKKFVIDKILGSSESSVCEISFSIVVKALPDGKEVPIYFPGAALSINRFVLGWKYVYMFDHLVPGFVKIHRSEGPSIIKDCYIADNLTSIVTDPNITNLPKSLLSAPTLVQVEKVLGFGVFSVKTNKAPVKLFLHRTNMHETSLGCSISKGSVFWIRNFRNIALTHANLSLLVGISIELESDWGLEKHSNFKTNEGTPHKSTIWENQPMQIQTIGHEYLEFNDFNSFSSGKRIVTSMHPWDIRHLCYFHYSLYVDIFNIIGAPKERSQILPLTLVQIVSNIRNSSPIYVTQKNEIIYPGGFVTGGDSTSLICCNSPEYQSKIIHPSQTLEFNSNTHNCNISCTDIYTGPFRMSSVKEWLDLLERLGVSQKLPFINSLFLDYNLSIEFLYYSECSIEAPKTAKTDFEAPHNPNEINSLRSQFIGRDSSPLYVGFFGKFLVEVVMNTDFDSTVWISNLLHVKDPYSSGPDCCYYPLFVLEHSGLNSTFNYSCQQFRFERKFIYIKKAMLRAYNKKMALFAHISDIVCINFENPPPIPRGLEIDILDGYPKGVLLFISEKEIRNTTKGCQYYLNCHPFFKTCPKFTSMGSDLNRGELIDYHLVGIKVPMNLYTFSTTSTFLLVLDQPIRHNSIVVISAMYENEFLRSMNAYINSQIEHYVFKELIFPTILKNPKDIEKGKNIDIYSVGKPFVEIMLLGHEFESILWPDQHKHPLYIRTIEKTQEVKGQMTVHDIKYWVESIFDWYLLSKRYPLFYRSIGRFREEMVDWLFMYQPYLSDFDIARIQTSFEHVKIIDILQFTGFNPLSLYGKWAIIRVTTNESIYCCEDINYHQNMYNLAEPPWGSGWVDIWFSQEDMLRHNIQLLLPGETISCSHLKIEKVISSQSTSPAHDLIKTVLSECLKQDKPIFYNMRNQVYPSEKKSSSGSMQIQNEKGRPAVTLSMFNNGVAVFRQSIQNSIIKRKIFKFNQLRLNYKRPESETMFRCLYLSPTSLTELTSYYHLDTGYEQYIHETLKKKMDPVTDHLLSSDDLLKSEVQTDYAPTNDQLRLIKSLKSSCCLETRHSFDYNKNPSPYFLAPEGTPITRNFLSVDRNDHSTFIAFNRAYCIRHGIAIAYPRRSAFYCPDLLSDLEKLRELDPDQIYTLKGSILHIQQIDISWFCLNCLKTASGSSKCECDADLGKDSTWRSMIVNLIGAVEVEGDDLDSKLLPFVVTNWNAIKLLAYVDNLETPGPDPKKLFHRMIEIANILWDQMDGLVSFTNFYTLYSFGNVPVKYDFPTCTNYSSDLKPTGIIGQIQLNYKKGVVNVPVDPISNLEMEVCVRFIRNPDDDAVELSYLHVIRWRERDIKAELEGKLQNLEPEL
ncbi:hypothetical protein OJ252_993 [Cryptosporidium canis]|uniref:Uncharacterized protein n=1 Tax=Cryptosporidium canis TaxID=195482 RepID=A0ABQ8P9D1_9CRYT|nr:hypothetical protein OJ252_993 [Cryptosporidium canis]